MGTNPFAGAEAWDVSTDTLLPVGEHVATITNPSMTRSQRGTPQIEVTVENNMGSMRDWITNTEKSLGKVVQVFDAAEVERPRDGEFDPITTELTQQCADRLHMKKVGVIVRDEPDYKDASKMRRRIQGYVKVGEINGSDVPIDTTPTEQPALGTADQSDIPFLWEGPSTEVDLFHAHENR